jgi:hypothetical protein
METTHQLILLAKVINKNNANYKNKAAFQLPYF